MNILEKVMFVSGKPFARRFVAGETMEDAFRVAEELNKQGFGAIINFLGEELKDREQARENARMYVNLIKEISLLKLNARVSLKPSQLGLKIDPKFYWLQLTHVARDAFLYKIPLEIDVETEDTIDETISATNALAKYYPGIDLRQAVPMNFKDSLTYLYNLETGFVKVRLCKGAYPSECGKKQIVNNFLSAVVYLLSRKSNPDFATHDLGLIYLVLAAKDKLPSPCGFQFLLGLRKKTWKNLLQKKERVNIYVPFGKNWIPYAKRRWKYIIRKIPSMIAGN